MEEIEKLYHLYYKDIYSYLYSMTRQHTVAEDITQSTFVTAIRALPRFRGESSVKTWLIGIARKECAAYFRRNPSLLPLDDSMEGRAEERDRYLSLLAALDRLPELQRQIVILRIANDLPFRSIGEIVHQSETYCRVSFYRAKQKLIEELS